MLGKIKMDIGKDAMTAYMYIIPGGEVEITESYLREELEKRGIKSGINEEVLHEIVNVGSPEKDYLVASGTPPVKGRDGRYELFFERRVDEGAPTIRADGSVDYSPVIHMVKKGDKVAEYHPPMQGTMGYTIFDAVVAPAPSKEGIPLKCINVERRGNEYIAQKDGRISLKGNKLEVKEYLLIDGNAGYSLGNINFNGDIHIQGDILTDVKVTAGGSIEVDGVVEGAKVVAGKNILVRHGIHGKGKAIIHAGKNLTSNFVEEAKEVRVGKDILVDYMINTDASAGGKIQATGKTGALIGGKIQAEEMIDVIRIGNDKGVKTQIIIRSDDPEKKQQGGVIVRGRAYPGTSGEIYGSKMENMAMTSGEIHFTEYGAEKCELGTFRRKRTAELKNSRQKNGKKLILLVDDDPVVLKTEYSYLCSDYQVVAVSSAQDALIFLKKRLPDLILLDYMMPKMNGRQLLEVIRKSQNSQCAATPVFFVTSVTSKKTRDECLQLYPQGYLIKPVGKEELLGIVEGFFAKDQES